MTNENENDHDTENNEELQGIHISGGIIGTGEDTRAGFVALIGAPNAGKSTLLNQLVGIKVSIVTHKVQTTRALIRGVAMEDKSQIIFVDTPGIFKPKRRLDRAMVDSAWGGAKDADLIAVLIDAKKGIDEEVEKILVELQNIKLPKVLILNKVDITKREKLLDLAAKANEYTRFDKTFMVSALNGSGTKDILRYFGEHVPEGPWLYPEDQASDVPLRMLAAEITREKLYLRLHQELPYISTVETDRWEEKKDGSVRIEQTIFVERDSQKSIVLGNKGQTIKAISQRAREEMEEAFETRIHLFVFVKVRENWSDDPERYRNMGLDFPR
ncbi:GTPase Era [Rhodobacteraceae bacterium RKSG542]|uniref:GTPase Era n=1 Tax=Pseudovibrio flavus TaxID=2529854 RepID=UPI0012BB9A80|nr:GTPase Era [Pseudovibrio flavus]MTI17401.1 GTPase Era [Pseudovibrio flavus]